MIELPQVLKTLEPFVYPDPVQHQFATIPSLAIRQAVADVRRFVSLGGVLDMSQFLRVYRDDFQCDTCLAGAMMICRGAFTRGLQDKPDDLYDCDDTYVSTNTELPPIVLAFNGLRNGILEPLLTACAVEQFRQRDLVIACEPEIRRLSFNVVEGALTPHRVDELCEVLSKLADRLEGLGH